MTASASCLRSGRLTCGGWRATAIPGMPVPRVMAALAEVFAEPCPLRAGGAKAGDPVAVLRRCSPCSACPVADPWGRL
jgi:hypothetical protein